MSVLLLYLLLQLFSVGGAAFALWKGGVGERWTALVVLANLAIGMTGQWLDPDDVELIRLANDGVAALAMLTITIRCGAIWMGGVMLFYAAQFSLHSFYLVTGRAPNRLYAIINNVDWNGVIWCLIIGTLVAWRQRVKAARSALQPAP